MHDHAFMERMGLADLPSSNDPTCPLAHCPASATCLPITVLPIPAEAELMRDLYSAPRIFVAHEGHGSRWYQLGGRTRPLQTSPHMIEIYEGGMTFDHFRWQGEPGRTVLIEFTDAHVQAVTHGELQRLDLRTQHELFDPQVSSISLELAQEALQGLPNGRLYAQGLSVSLVGLLASRHAHPAVVPLATATGQLGALQQKRLMDLIHGHLASDLSLTRMADEVGLSTHHFARCSRRPSARRPIATCSTSGSRLQPPRCSARSGDRSRTSRWHTALRARPT